ncbi:MAG: lytic transglycosylase domain-containing protein, partial [Flavobacterium sp.]
MISPKKIVLWFALIGVSILMIFASTTTSTVEKKIVNISLPETIDFAGELVPLHIIDVKERFDREMIINTNLHSTTTLVIKRANRLFP